MVIAVPGVPLQCLYLRRIFGRWAPVRVIAPSAGGASMMGTASRRSQGRSAFLHPSTGRLEPRRSLQLSQVFESVFLREGTRLRRVGGAREAQATKGCRACFVGLMRSLARNAPPTRRLGFGASRACRPTCLFVCIRRCSDPFRPSGVVQCMVLLSARGQGTQNRTIRTLRQTPGVLAGGAEAACRRGTPGIDLETVRCPRARSRRGETGGSQHDRLHPGTRQELP